MTEDAVAFWVSSASDYGVFGYCIYVEVQEGESIFATKKTSKDPKSNPSQHRSTLYRYHL